MISILWSVVLFAQNVMLLPFNICFYIFYAIWKIVEHTLLVPLLLMVRISLFGLVYMPLTPVLHAINVDYDHDMPVEMSLFHLIVDLLPHIWFFVFHMTHFCMISVFVGTFVGMCTGFNISIVSRLLTIPEPKTTKSRKTQTTPFVAKLETKIKKPAAKSATAEAPVAFVANVPVVKKEPVSPVLAFKPVFSKDSPTEEIYEDDDGYGYMSYEAMDTKEKRPPFVSTILEESDSEISELPPTDSDRNSLETLDHSKLGTHLLRPDTVPSTIGSTFSAEKDVSTLNTNVSLHTSVEEK